VEISQAELEAIIKRAVGDALAGYASGAAAPHVAVPVIVGDTAGPWVPGKPARNVAEADRNACNANGRDAEGFRHRSRSPGEIAQFEGSLDDAEQELKAAHLWQGDFLDFGPDQIGERFTSWKSASESQELRGLVVRYALLTNRIPTAKERKLAPMAAPTFDAAEDTFATMDSADLWAWIVSQRGLTGSAGGFNEGGLPAGDAGGGRKG